MDNRFVVLTLLTLILGFTVTGYAQEGAKPPLSEGRIAGEFFVGVVGGTVVGIIPAILFYTCYPINRANDGEEWRLFGIALVYLPIGYAIGSAIGVYLVGNRGNQTGSFTYTLVGASLAGIGCLAAAFLSNSFGFIPVILIAAPAVATIVFNWMRRYKTDTGLGQMRF